eukprot:6215027-Prymnesium_polylepis.1
MIEDDRSFRAQVHCRHTDPKFHPPETRRYVDTRAPNGCRGNGPPGLSRIECLASALASVNPSSRQ